MSKGVVSLAILALTWCALNVQAVPVAEAPHSPRFQQLQAEIAVKPAANGRKPATNTRVWLNNLKGQFVECTAACAESDAPCAQLCSTVLNDLKSLDADSADDKSGVSACTQPIAAVAKDKGPKEAALLYLTTLTSMMSEKPDQFRFCLRGFSEWAQETLAPYVQNLICLGEYNQAYALAKQYDGSITQIALKKITKLFPRMSTKDKGMLASELFSTMKLANKNFEFQRIGKKLNHYKPVQYISRLLLQRTLSFVQAVFHSSARPSGELQPFSMLGKSEGGIGFVCNTNVTSDWINGILADTNARVYTSIAYHLITAILRKTSDNGFKTLAANEEYRDRIDGTLFKRKAATLRCNPFGPSPLVLFPRTTQPPGWPWLKYFAWHKASLLPNQGKLEFVESKKNPNSDFCRVPNDKLSPPLSPEEQTCGEWASGVNFYNILFSKIPDPAHFEKRNLGVDWAEQLRQKGLPALAGPSSTTSQMIECARYLKFNKNEMILYRLLMVAWMVPARDHSFAEIVGAFDPYFYAATHKYGAGLNVEGDMGVEWLSRASGKWDEAYNHLLPKEPFTLDAIPAFKGKLAPEDAEEVELPGYPAVTVDPKELNHLLTGHDDESCYPSHYLSDEFIKAGAEQIKSPNGPNFESIDSTCGLLKDTVDYCVTDSDTHTTHNIRTFTLSSRPKGDPTTKSLGQAPYLDKDEFAAVAKYMSTQDKSKLYSAALGWLAVAFKESSIAERELGEGHINPLYEIFATEGPTSALSSLLCPLLPTSTTPPQGADCFYALVDLISGKLDSSDPAIQSILAKLAKDEEAGVALVTGAALATVRAYTQSADSILNIDYGPTKPLSDFTQQLMAKMGMKYPPKSVSGVTAEREIMKTLLDFAIAAPLFPKKEQLTYHGSQDATCASAVAALKNNQGKDNWAFPGFTNPGFMSTTYDLNVAVGYAWMKGCSLQVQPNSKGAYISDISAAPGEREVLYSSASRFKVSSVCYLIHKPKPDLSDMQRKLVLFDPNVSARKVQSLKVTHISDKPDGEPNQACEDTFKTIGDALKSKRSFDEMTITLVSLTHVANPDLDVPGRAPRKDIESAPPSPTAQQQPQQQPIPHGVKVGGGPPPPLRPPPPAGGPMPPTYKKFLTGQKK